MACLSVNAHVICCSFITHYNLDEMPSQDHAIGERRKTAVSRRGREGLNRERREREREIDARWGERGLL